MSQINYPRLAGYLLIFLISAGLLGYGWLTFELDRAQKALSQGDLDGAMDAYARAERPFQELPWLAELFPEEHKQASLNQVAILYRQHKNAEASAKLEQIPAQAAALVEDGDYLFWTGTVLLREATETKDSEASIKAFKAALSEYQRGLAAQPDDWDLKFNYELLRNMLGQPDRNRKAQEQKVKSIIDKMRPTDPAQKQAPPEKRG